MTEHEKLVKEHEDNLGSGVIVRDFYFKGGYQLKFQSMDLLKVLSKETFPENWKYFDWN